MLQLLTRSNLFEGIATNRRLQGPSVRADHIQTALWRNIAHSLKQQGLQLPRNDDGPSLPYWALQPMLSADALY